MASRWFLWKKRGKLLKFSFFLFSPPLIAASFWTIPLAPDTIKMNRLFRSKQQLEFGILGKKAQGDVKALLFCFAAHLLAKLFTLDDFLPTLNRKQLLQSKIPMKMMKNSFLPSERNFEVLSLSYKNILTWDISLPRRKKIRPLQLFFKIDGHTIFFHVYGVPWNFFSSPWFVRVPPKRANKNSNQPFDFPGFHYYFISKFWERYLMTDFYGCYYPTFRENLLFWALLSSNKQKMVLLFSH